METLRQETQIREGIRIIQHGDWKYIVDENKKPISTRFQDFFTLKDGRLCGRKNGHITLLDERCQIVAGGFDNISLSEGSGYIATCGERKYILDMQGKITGVLSSEG